MKPTKEEFKAIVSALVDGANYYMVAYPVGVNIRPAGGSFILYDKDEKILTSNMDRAELEKAIEKAKKKAYDLI